MAGRGRHVRHDQVDSSGGTGTGRVGRVVTRGKRASVEVVGERSIVNTVAKT